MVSVKRSIIAIVTTDAVRACFYVWPGYVRITDFGIARVWREENA